MDALRFDNTPPSPDARCHLERKTIYDLRRSIMIYIYYDLPAAFADTIKNLWFQSIRRVRFLENGYRPTHDSCCKLLFYRPYGGIHTENPIYVIIILLPTPLIFPVLNLSFFVRLKRCIRFMCRSTVFGT